MKQDFDPTAPYGRNPVTGKPRPKPEPLPAWARMHNPDKTGKRNTRGGENA